MNFRQARKYLKGKTKGKLLSGKCLALCVVIDLAMQFPLLLIGIRWLNPWAKNVLLNRYLHECQAQNIKLI